MPSPKKQNRSVAQAIAGVLLASSNALAAELEAAVGFETPESFKQHLLKALDESAGFEGVVREWHEHSQRLSSPKPPASQPRKPQPSGRTQAARYEAGSKRQGRK